MTLSRNFSYIRGDYDTSAGDLENRVFDQGVVGFGKVAHQGQ